MQDQIITEKLGSRLNAVIVVLRQGATLYGINGERVREIVPLPEIAAIPRMPEYLRGIFNYKGNVVPLISLAALTGERDARAEQVCIIFTIGDMLLALSVEEVVHLLYDNGQSFARDAADAEDKLLVVRKVLKEDAPIFVLDLPAIVDKLTHLR